MNTMQGLKRDIYALEVLDRKLGDTLTLMGWCHKQRDLGGLIFITLRDRTGEVQLCIDENSPDEVKQLASTVRSEFVLAVRGVLRKRSSVNPTHPTGELEIHVQQLIILNQAKTPPFYIEEDLQANTSLRLKHRYLDLRRPNMQRNLQIRHQFTNCVHEYFNEHGFLEIETPMLGKSTPEGARDYLVPSRVFPGQFFALPQSPQLYKQLLMVAGVDRYLQIARCFRDEDLRADRQPEFTQIDLEMSFVEEDDVQKMVEGFIAKAMSQILDYELSLPLKKMPYEEAMRRFGSDKPDIRFGLELQDVSSWASTLDFPLFKDALALAEGRVQAIVVPQGSKLTRKEINELTEHVKTYRAKALLWFANEMAPRSSFLKFMNEEQVANLRTILSLKEEDMVFFIADTLSVVQEALGQLRLLLAQKFNLIKEGEHALLWVTEFPLLEYDEEAGRYVAKHHPFTSPRDEDIELLTSNPAKVRAKAYDLVMDGVELGGGSIRIHSQEIQEQMFSLLGFSKEEAYDNFSFLLDAFQYGVPPHGGCALGLDRAVMLFVGASSLRDVIAFPKVQTSADLMTNAPSSVALKQLEELALKPFVLEEIDTQG